MKLWLDTETVGLCGPCKLIQYSLDDGPVEFIKLFRGWPGSSATREKVGKLVELLNQASTTLVAYNAAFDLFHLYRVVGLLNGFSEDSPERFTEPFKCRVLDLMVPAFLTSPLAPFAFSRGSNRSVAQVRKIPRVTESFVRDLIYSRLSPLMPRGFELKVSEKEVKNHPELVTLIFWVKGGVRLKGLMQHWGVPTMQIEDVWPLPKKGSEKPWLPYPDPEVHDPVELQCEGVMRSAESPFWKYSKLDILYLKLLYEKLGKPEVDHHSTCTHAVAWTRYFGFQVDHQKLWHSITIYNREVETLEKRLTFNLRSAPQRLKALQALDPLIQSTGKDALKAAVACGRPCAELANAILQYGPARQRLLQCMKVAECRTRRAHPTFRVMGTSTGRMAGSAGLNWQGIGAVDYLEGEEHDELAVEDVDSVQETLEDGPQETTNYGLRAAILAPMVGDFSAFEVGIAEAIYQDAQLSEDLDNGVDLHCMVTASAHPKALERKMSYEQVRKAYKKHDPTITSWRKDMKRVVFGIFYFATPFTIAQAMGIDFEQATEVVDNICKRYPGIARYRQLRERQFMTADTERWTSDCILKMQEAVSDLTGFTRHWKFEKQIADILWRLGKSRVKTGLTGTIVRSLEKGTQTIDGAVMSSLLGAAIATQSAVMRQAGNMPVQATGANITKKLMALLWERHRLPMMNVHDELVVGHCPHFNLDAIKPDISLFEEEYRGIVKHLKFEYAPTNRWSDK